MSRNIKKCLEISKKCLEISKMVQIGSRELKYEVHLISTMILPI